MTNYLNNLFHIKIADRICGFELEGLTVIKPIKVGCKIILKFAMICHGENNMARRKTDEDIVKAIVKVYGENYFSKDSSVTQQFTFGAFVKAMRSESIYSDLRPMKNKWDNLVSKGIIDDLPKCEYDKAFIHLDTLVILFPSVPTQHLPKACTHTSHTHISEVKA